ncbi:hypothetical protein [Actinoplanes sp. NPDC049118]|uniref:hypothetical protein n=1 Tax=Actinoplanes sp. NPDC049118 TaxID=3155769 RepID=UPI003409BA36
MAATAPMDRLGPGGPFCLTFPDAAERLGIPAGRARGKGVTCRTDLDVPGATLPERGVVHGDGACGGGSDVAPMTELPAQRRSHGRGRNELALRGTRRANANDYGRPGARDAAAQW